MMIFIRLLFLIACSDYAVSSKPKEPTIISREPDIVIETRVDDSTSPIGCESDTEFIVRNVGNKELIIEDVVVYSSVPVDSSFTGGIIIVPITLDPDESLSLPITFSPTDLVEDEVVLKVSSNDPDEPEAFGQIELNTTAPNLVSDEYTVEVGRMIDLLIVVDNSGSMSDEQQRLADNALNIINGLQAYSSDYQIAVITTDSSSLRGPIINRNSADPVLELESQVTAGTSGYGLEKGIEKSVDALSNPSIAGTGSAFLRQSARLVIVWISDEDDYSGMPPLTDIVATLWSLKPAPSDVVSLAIVGDIPRGCDYADPGFRYIELTNMLGGNWISICDANWQTAFEQLTVSAGSSTAFPLTQTPIPSTISVHVNGRLSYDWVYVVSYNSVTLNPGFRPQLGSSIKIDYATQSECE